MSDEEMELPPLKKQKTETNIDIQLVTATAEPDFTEDSITDNNTVEFCIDKSKYNDLVNLDELEKLKEFQVLDEVKSNDEDTDEEESDSSDGKSEGVPEEEIEKMLEEDLPEDFKGAPKPKEKPYHTRQKIVLEEKGINYFEVLPLDWMIVRHYSGMPVYMHRASRVCTLSKPYFLGKGNTRRHDIPISAIPCLNYRKALEEEAKQKEIDRRIADQIKNGEWQNSEKDILTNNIYGGVDKNSQHNGRFNQIKDTPNLLISSNESSSQVNIDSSQTKNIESNVFEMKINELTPKIKNGDNLDVSKVDHEDVITIRKFSLKNEEANKDALIIDECSQDQVVGTDTVANTEHNQEINEYEGDMLSTKPVLSLNVRKVDHEDVVAIRKCPFKNEEANKDALVIDECSQAQVVGIDTVANTENNQEINKDEGDMLSAKPVVLPGGIVMPPPRVETVNKSWKTQHLTHEQVNDYCKKLFQFKTVNIMHFKRWADRRKYAKARKTLQYPTLPEGTKLITIPAQPATTQENGGVLGGGGKATKRDWVMNMNGRSYLSVFHEYVRRALQKQPQYEFKQLENAATPYQATVYIGGMQYGVGRGTSKRLAKANAARASIHILIPEMRDDAEPPLNEPDFSFFDYVGIEDPRITEFCVATCEPSPHAILRTCLLRNFGAGDRHIHTEMKKLEYQKIELTMKVGKHSATVVCKNKKTAKQRASQAILQALHPHVRSWGSLLRLYGSRSVKSCKEKKLEEQQITLLQDKARHNEPNYAVLEKLRNEMRRLRERDEAVVPIGTLLVSDDLPTHSGSNLNNVDL